MTKYQLMTALYQKTLYEIYSFDDNNVVLQDAKYPLFTRDMPRDEFDRKLRENNLNDRLIKPDETTNTETTYEELER